MKFCILALFICTAVAQENILDELDKILSEDDKSEVNEANVLEKLNDALSKEKLNEALSKEELNDALSKEELEALLESDSPEEKPGKGRGGGKFGYCLDGTTFADGPSQRGCARKLCYDAKTTQCIEDFKGLSKQAKKKKCFSDFWHYRERCPYSCGFCKPPSPTIECAKKYRGKAIHGCCWDGSAALTPDKSDCMVCMDFRPHTCKQFYDNMQGQQCGTNSYRIRRFLFARCPRLCGRCVYKG